MSSLAISVDLSDVPPGVSQQNLSHIIYKAWRCRVLAAIRMCRRFRTRSVGRSRTDVGPVMQSPISPRKPAYRRRHCSGGKTSPDQCSHSVRTEHRVRRVRIGARPQCCTRSLARIDPRCLRHCSTTCRWCPKEETSDRRRTDHTRASNRSACRITALSRSTWNAHRRRPVSNRRVRRIIVADSCEFERYVAVFSRG